MKKKPPKRRRNPAQRVRVASVQVYLSRSEHEALMMLAQRQHLTTSQTLRRLITRSAAAVLSKEQPRKQPPADPRQLDVSDLFE